ncbi:hypothetical protein [Mesorhizobium sp. M8A.F.Ca.ET.165.01.1.1]|uniref:hypothetical protein n=1 Tax=Mesorhizobium sp. M8A.F.Ca.ET.165.01.1.1 TaxID=2563960 RepID=UPI0010937283|nr:hypothetical protein [Mesorhizobium sp. M8A.F.Ca.ET.165.01.1.1]TGT40258.1 hypothetical protein EN808_16800 [Mesorhizobium sp. M8A.F.Ca.ET.165.01.1.1]
MGGDQASTIRRLAHWKCQLRTSGAESDGKAQRYREEAGTLAALADKDAVLVGQAELLRSMLEGVARDAMLAGRREIEVGIAAITATLRKL